MEFSEDDEDEEDEDEEEISESLDQEVIVPPQTEINHKLNSKFNRLDEEEEEEPSYHFNKQREEGEEEEDMEESDSSSEQSEDDQEYLKVISPQQKEIIKKAAEFNLDPEQLRMIKDIFADEEEVLGDVYPIKDISPPNISITRMREDSPSNGKLSNFFFASFFQLFFFYYF